MMRFQPERRFEMMDRRRRIMLAAGKLGVCGKDLDLMIPAARGGHGQTIADAGDGGEPDLGPETLQPQVEIRREGRLRRARRLQRLVGSPAIAQMADALAPDGGVRAKARLGHRHDGARLGCAVEVAQQPREPDVVPGDFGRRRHKPATEAERRLAILVADRLIRGRGQNGGIGRVPGEQPMHGLARRLPVAGRAVLPDEVRRDYGIAGRHSRHRLECVERISLAASGSMHGQPAAQGHQAMLRPQRLDAIGEAKGQVERATVGLRLGTPRPRIGPRRLQDVRLRKQMESGVVVPPRQRDFSEMEPHGEARGAGVEQRLGLGLPAGGLQVAGPVDSVVIDRRRAFRGYSERL